ncbi:MAG TPA: hypothetical protein VIV55_03355 [Flavobacterium sp.]
MKAFKLLFTILVLSATHSYAQLDVTKIISDNKDYFITRTINYPVTGIYLFEGKTEPIVELKGNGTGIFQFEDLTKKKIEWGIQCDNVGIPTAKKGYDYASYTLWYKNKDGKDSGEDYWIPVHFSIHFNQHKMYVFGDRSKTYVDPIEIEKENDKE